MSQTPGDQRTISVLLTHRFELVCDLLERALSNEPDIDPACVYEGTEEALRLAGDFPPDVLVMDPESPGRSPFDVARVVRTRHDRVKILFLGAEPSDVLIEQALHTGCSGYLTQHNPADVIAETIRTIAGGGFAFCHTIRERIVVDSNTGPRLEAMRTRTSTLSNRELEVLGYIARGLTKKQMAEDMHISVKTVDNHASSLMRKLDIHNRVDLARFAIRERIVEL